MRGVARINDRTIGSCSEHGDNISGKIVSASSNRLVNNRGVARLGDRIEAECGHVAKIITASTNDSTNSKGTARLNDRVGDSPYTGKIVTASANVFVN